MNENNNREEKGFEAYIEREFIDNTEEFELPAERKKSFRIAFAYAFALVMVLIVFGVTGTYAYYNVEIANESETTALNTTMACFDVNLSETSPLSLGDYNYPVTDDFALSNINPTVVTVSNSCQSGSPINYSLYLTSAGSIPEDKIKVKIAESDNTVVSNWDTDLLSNKTTQVVQSVPEALKTAVANAAEKAVENKDITSTLENGTYRLIESSTVAAGVTKTYKVYLWIDYGATNDLEGGVQGKNFTSLVSAVIN